MDMKEDNKGGRPKESIDNFPETWQSDILALYEDGASDVEIKALIIKWRGSISVDLWNRWMQEEEVFSITIKKGRQLARAWWEKHGRLKLGNKDFNTVLWYMNMKNRYGWADKKEINHSGSINTTIKVKLPEELKDDE